MTRHQSEPMSSPSAIRYRHAASEYPNVDPSKRYYRGIPLYELRRLTKLYASPTERSPGVVYTLAEQHYRSADAIRQLLGQLNRLKKGIPLTKDCSLKNLTSEELAYVIDAPCPNGAAPEVTQFSIIDDPQPLRTHELLQAILDELKELNRRWA